MEKDNHSESDLSLINKAIQSGPDSRSPRSYFNTPCLACRALEHEMIRLGALIFCWKCFQINFLVLMFFNPEEFDENYTKWLEVLYATDEFK